MVRGMEGERLLEAHPLRAIAPQRLLKARLVGVPCLRLLVLRYRVHRYFTAVHGHEDRPHPKPAETFLAVTRRGLVVRHYELSHPPTALARSARRCIGGPGNLRGGRGGRIGPRALAAQRVDVVP